MKLKIVFFALFTFLLVNNECYSKDKNPIKPKQISCNDADIWFYETGADSRTQMGNSIRVKCNWMWWQDCWSLRVSSSGAWLYVGTDIYPVIFNGPPIPTTGDDPNDPDPAHEINEYDFELLSSPTGG